MRRVLVAIVTASALMFAVPGPAQARSPVAHTITYDRYSMMIDGHRVWLWSAPGS